MSSVELHCHSYYSFLEAVASPEALAEAAAEAGMAALALLVSGIMRVLYFGQGSEFYTTNPLFWWKVGLYLSVGGLSLYPTITYVLWAIPLRKGELPKVSEALASRLAWILNIELVGFALIPLMATLMARGVGLPAA